MIHESEMGKSLMKKSRRIWLWLSILFVLPSLLAFSPPPQNEDITIDVDFGYDNYYRANEWTPLRITVQSEVSIDGFLRVSVPNGNDAIDSIYQTPLKIDRRSGSATLFVHIVPLELSREFTIEVIQRSDGRILATNTVRTVNIKRMTLRDMLYVVVTESITDTINMTNLPIGRGDSQQANLSISELPDSAVALETIDVLVFFDADTGSLTIPQRNAIKNWVYGGGHLIVHTGQNWNRTTAGLNDLLPTTVSSTVTLEDVSSLGAYLSFPDDILTEHTASIASNTPKPNAQVLAKVDDVPLLVRQELGAGLVDFIAFDPLTEPFSSYDALPRLWFELTANARLQPSWHDGVLNMNTAERAVRIESNFEFPPVMQLLGFLGVYVVLIGPLNYLVLSRLKRPEFAWFTIPILIVGFTTVAYFAGFNLRGDDPSVNHVSVVQVWANSDVAQIDSAVGIFSPRRTTYDVEASGDMVFRPLSAQSDSSGFGSSNITDTNLIITQGNTYRADDIPVDAGIITSFMATGFAPAADYESQATWYLSDSFERIQLDGSFSSEIQLDDAVLLFKDGFIILGDIPADKTVDFQTNIQMQEPAWNTFGNRTEFNSGFNFAGRNGRFFNQYGFSQCPEFEPIDTNSKIMQTHINDCDYSQGFEDLELQSRQFLLDSVIHDMDFSGGMGADMYVVGWADTAPFNVDLPENSPVINHKSLYIFQVPAEFQASDVTSQRVMIPPGLMTWTVAGRNAQNTRRDVSPYTMNLGAIDQAVLRFTPMESLQNVNVDIVQVSASISGTTTAIAFEGYNWTTGEWDIIELDPFNNNATFEGETVQNYVGPNNAMELRVRLTTDVQDSGGGFSGDFVNVNLIEVTMYGTLAE